MALISLGLQETMLCSLLDISVVGMTLQKGVHAHDNRTNGVTTRL